MSKGFSDKSSVTKQDWIRLIEAISRVITPYLLVVTGAAISTGKDSRIENSDSARYAGLCPPVVEDDDLPVGLWRRSQRLQTHPEGRLVQSTAPSEATQRLRLRAFREGDGAFAPFKKRLPFESG